MEEFRVKHDKLHALFVKMACVKKNQSLDDVLPYLNDADAEIRCRAIAAVITITTKGNVQTTQVVCACMNRDVDEKVKSTHGVLGPDGKIYAIPMNASGVLCVDPVERTATTFGDLGGAQENKIGLGVLGLDGKVLMLFNYCSM